MDVNDESVHYAIGFQIIDFTRPEGEIRVRCTGWYVVEDFDR